MYLEFAGRRLFPTTPPFTTSMSIEQIHPGDRRDPKEEDRFDPSISSGQAALNANGKDRKSRPFHTF